MNRKQSSSRQYFEALVYTIQECFYRVIWRERCERFAVWEKSKGISRVVKLGKRDRKALNVARRDTRSEATEELHPSSSSSCTEDGANDCLPNKRCKITGNIPDKGNKEKKKSQLTRLKERVTEVYKIAKETLWQQITNSLPPSWWAK